MLDKKEIEHIAGLARIKLDKVEIEKYQKDLSGILNYFIELQKLDTGKIESIGHITGMKNNFRVDRAEDLGSIGKEELLNNAPAKKEGHIKVKSVL